MHTLSSASRTCMASPSAVECTATVWMPSSWQARSTRSAISPRLAIRILSNIGLTGRPHAEERTQCASRSMWPPPSFETGASRPLQDEGGTTMRVVRAPSLDDQQRLAEFDRLSVLDQYLAHRAGPGCRNLIHG